MTGPTCGQKTHALCIRGCVLQPSHLGQCRCIHDVPAPRPEDKRR